MEIIKKIKEKKELSGIPDNVVAEELENYLARNKISLPKNEKGVKLVVKEVRARLRRNVGQYKSSSAGAGKRIELLKNGELDKLAKSHTSTKERIEIYPQFKEVISKLNPCSIIDLGCGINPVFIASKGIVYYACDINKDDLDLVDCFFKLKKIDGKTSVLDLRKPEQFKFPPADLCLILKVFDLLGKDKRKMARQVLASLECKVIITSFPTKTLSGKPMNSPRRFWFEIILEDLNLNFEIMKSRNEIFYLISSQEIPSLPKTLEAQ